jgi:hypothetical protein
MVGMTRDEIVQILRANLNKPVEIKFTDGAVQRVMPLTVEKDGFMHDLASQEDIVIFVSFEEVASVTPEA